MLVHRFEIQAYKEGLDAATAGEHFTANPYRDGSSNAREWEAGWDEGFMEMGGNLSEIGLGEAGVKQ